MQAGKLRKRITIKQPAGTVDSFGEQTDAWITAATVWGSLEQRGGEGEGSQGGRMEAFVTYECRIRNYSGLTITPGYKLVIGTASYDVLAAADVEGRTRELVMICREVR